MTSEQPPRLPATCLSDLLTLPIQPVESGDPVSKPFIPKSTSEAELADFKEKMNEKKRIRSIFEVKAFWICLYFIAYILLASASYFLIKWVFENL